MALIVRTSVEPAAMVGSIRRELAAIDRDLPIYDVERMTEYFAAEAAQPYLPGRRATAVNPIEALRHE